MRTDDVLWLEKCKEEPEKYRIDVDNDCIFVTDLGQDECVHTFSSYGYEFALELLQYIGCNADMV